MQTGEILTLKEVAQYLGCHCSTIYRMLKRREIIAFKIGGSDWRFRKQDVQEWIERQTAKQRAEWDKSSETAQTPQAELS